ncbi:MAG: LolA family protein [Candidatus Azotimanducaceae bacterium WSBS_2022_MAG_OTU7]
MLRILLMLCLALPAMASEQRAREIIDEMEQLYRGASSDATMTMQVQTPNYDRTLTVSGQSFGKDYGFFRIHAPKIAALRRLKRDEEMWNYFQRSTRSSRFRRP